MFFFSNNVVVAVVACGDRFQETMNMLKSAIMFSKVHLKFIVVTEDKLIKSFNEKLEQWQDITNKGFSYTVMPLTFPIENSLEWKKLFKPCASQRLFLPVRNFNLNLNTMYCVYYILFQTVLKDIDSILYVDTDTLFLTPVEEVWKYFGKMNSSQMAAVAPEHEDPNVGWYNRFARHPYYGKLGNHFNFDKLLKNN